MKKTFILALFALAFTSSFAKSPSLTNTSFNQSLNIANASKNVDITLTSANGSTVHIVGNAVFSQAGVSAFSGTVTISGRETSGTVAFAVDGKELSMVFNSPDLRRLSKIKWAGDARSAAYISILNETGINRSLVAVFQAFG